MIKLKDLLNEAKVYRLQIFTPGTGGKDNMKFNPSKIPTGKLRIGNQLACQNKPQGGFYLMPEFVGKKFNSSEEMCKDLLEKTGVALLPGSDFGFDKKKMLAILSFTDFDGQEFMTQTQNEQKIDKSLILKLAPKIVEGVDKLKKWSTST